MVADPSLAAARTALDALPALDPPELFGLHASAEAGYRSVAAKAALGVLAGLRPRGGGAGAAAPADARDRAADAAAAALQASLPAPFAAAEIQAGLARHPGGTDAPLAVCVRQEATTLGAALARAAADLASLRAALAGAASLTPALVAAGDALADGRPPPGWAKASWAAPTAAAWATTAAARRAQLASWLARGPPRALWLPGLANLGAFFAAVKQDAARAAAGVGWALDDVSLIAAVAHPAIPDAASLRADATPPGGGVYVSGLWLDGAAWDARAGRLADPDARRAGPAPLPLVHVRAVRGTDAAKAAAAGASFDAPVYRGPARAATGAVARVALAADGGADRWALRGVALLCEPE